MAVNPVIQGQERCGVMLRKGARQFVHVVTGKDPQRRRNHPVDRVFDRYIQRRAAVINDHVKFFHKPRFIMTAGNDPDNPFSPALKQVAAGGRNNIRAACAQKGNVPDDDLA